MRWGISQCYLLSSELATGQLRSRNLISPVTNPSDITFKQYNLLVNENSYNIYWGFPITTDPPTPGWMFLQLLTVSSPRHCIRWYGKYDTFTIRNFEYLIVKKEKNIYSGIYILNVIAPPLNGRRPWGGACILCTLWILYTSSNILPQKVWLLCILFRDREVPRDWLLHRSKMTPPSPPLLLT